jgi:hypothetical protein
MVVVVVAPAQFQFAFFSQKHSFRLLRPVSGPSPNEQGFSNSAFCLIDG